MVLALQLILVLACLFYGARKGGITLGLLGGIGLVILAFGFGLAPGKPPTDVMLTIVAVVAASATLQDAYAQLMHGQIWFPSPLAKGKARVWRGQQGGAEVRGSRLKKSSPWTRSEHTGLLRAVLCEESRSVV